jgi:hypothetical protein
MSANNWAICPRCAKRDMEIADQEVRLTERARDEAYGHVPRDKFMALVQAASEARSLRQIKIDNPHRPGLQTLREDWEIGILPGTSELFINYHGRCDECDLDIRFHHTESVDGVSTAQVFAPENRGLLGHHPMCDRDLCHSDCLLRKEQIARQP